jgi:hypothetical protein
MSLASKVEPISNLRHFAPVRSTIFRQCALVVLSFFAAPACAQTISVPSAIESARKTVAPVVCIVRDAATGQGHVRFQIIGTAFIVEPRGVFVTADHVFNEFLKAPYKDACMPAITFPVGGWKRAEQDVRYFSFDVAVCRVNEASDIAICRTTNDLSTEKTINYEVATVSTVKPLDGTEIFFTGFPLQATDPISSVGSIAGYTADSGYNVVLIDKNAWPGASGSPIYLADGKTVVGMLTRTGTGDAAGLSFGIVGTRIAGVLADTEAKWAEAEKQTGEQKK